MLRDYQENAIGQLYYWLQNYEGNPCLVLPTGSGKSHIVAALCKDALQNWPETRILMLTHVKELIEQNAEKMRLHWPNAPMGIYSAGMNQRDLGEPITFASIQSVRNRAKQIGFIDLILVDECHLVGHKEEGGYRQLIGELQKINPALRVIGLTATPYRLGHGWITTKPAIFDEPLIYPTTIKELVDEGYLSPLRSKVTAHSYDTSQVHKRGGEFVEGELQKLIDTDEQNQRVADEIILLAEDRRAWLIFCAGVEHAQHMEGILNSKGIPSGCVLGETSSAERESLIQKFRTGELRALTNANVLTTGFDYPDIDLIAMLRPTCSTSLYVQMAGRGMRPKSHTDHCLVLDFAGNVESHGPITHVQPSETGTAAAAEKGKSPTKTCPECNEINHLSAVICAACGHAFESTAKALELSDADIMALDGGRTLQVGSWEWRPHLSANSLKMTLKLTYIPSKFFSHKSAPRVTEYFPINHEGYAGTKAWKQLKAIAFESGAGIVSEAMPLEMLVSALQNAQPPTSIEYSEDGRFYKVRKRKFEEAPKTAWAHDDIPF